MTQPNRTCSITKTHPNLPRVLHFTEDYLLRTQTFIYDRIRSGRRYCNIVLAHRMVNLDEFPWPNLAVVPLGFTKRAVRKIFRGFNREPLFESMILKNPVMQLSPSLVHAHFGHRGWLMSRLCRDLSLPLVVTFYGYDLTDLPNRNNVWAHRYARLFDMASACFVEGPVMRERLMGLGCPGSKIRIVPIALDLSGYPYHPTPKPSGDALHIVQVGRFVEKKGHEDTVLALSMLRKTLPDVRLDLVGSGPLKGRIERLVAEKGLEDVVRFLGELPRSSCIHAMTEADILVQPSRTATGGDTEGGAPTVLIEAEAIGLPVVATRHADIPFVLPAGRPLAPERDPSALADFILDLVHTDPEEWRNIVEEGHRHVLNQHDIQSVRQRIEEIYDDLIERPPGLGAASDSIEPQPGEVSDRRSTPLP